MSRMEPLLFSDRSLREVIIRRKFLAARRLVLHNSRNMIKFFRAASDATLESDNRTNSIEKVCLELSFGTKF